MAASANEREKIQNIGANVKRKMHYRGTKSHAYCGNIVPINIQTDTQSAVTCKRCSVKRAADNRKAAYNKLEADKGRKLTLGERLRFEGLET